VGVTRRARSNRPARWAAIGALVLVLAVVAIARRVATETLPPLVLHRALAAYVRVPGRPPTLAWPREGEAAAEVEGVGGLGGSGGSTPVPIASVAKVMTAYLTLLEHPLAAGERGFVMTITPVEVEEQGDRTALGESTIPVREGERLTERQALQALLLPSANNIAAALADYDAGGERAFVARMNAAARELGMTSTTYTDPSGFEDSTVSTAADQLKLARAAMNLPAFAAIVAEPSAVLPVAGSVSNLDALVGEEGYVGIKTGSDSAAGGCLMFAKRVTIAGTRLTVLGVVLGQREGALVEAALASAQRLGNSAAAALHVETVLPAGTTVLSATNASGSHAQAVTAAPLREVGWGGAKLRALVVRRASVTRLRAHQRVATVALLSGMGAVSTAAVARSALEGPSLAWRLRHLL
jgi:serine-type D-Ala-D-Ala carboxypeptidase (penicillin-binding protein 5/6)